jgi:hypothetical protein
MKLAIIKSLYFRTCFSTVDLLTLLSLLLQLTGLQYRRWVPSALAQGNCSLQLAHWFWDESLEPVMICLSYLSVTSCFRSLFFGLVEDDMMVDGGAVVGGNIISIQIMRQ